MKKRFLHICRGEKNPARLPKLFATPEWQEIRFDTDPNMNITGMESASMDGVFTAHNLQFLPSLQVPFAVKEFFRVLKPGGIAMITVPDMQVVAAYIAQGRLENKLYDSPAGPISPIDIIYGSRQTEQNRIMHKSGFTAVTLARRLMEAGFSNIIVQRDWIHLWATAYKLQEGDPRYGIRPEIRNKDLSGPKSAELPFWYRRLLQIQENPEIKSDELDIPPKIWKPLGLNKK